MKRSLVIFGLCFLFLTMGFVIAQSNETSHNESSITCTDSDGGLNFYVKGTAQSNGASSTDFCYDNSGLKEYSCSSNSIAINALICPNGCVDGACVNTTSTSNFTPSNQTAQTNTTCTDSDGKDYNKYGITTDSLGTVSDGCSLADNKTLTEYYCSGNSKISVNYICPNGCENGICVQTKNECSLHELEQKICSFLGIDYEIKRETQCKFIITYQGIEEEFELRMLSQRTLKNGVSIKNNYPCNVSSLNLIFFGGVPKIITNVSGEEITDKGFRYSYWQCYDDEEQKQKEETFCKLSDTWKQEAHNFCDGHCGNYHDENKCGVKLFGLSDECEVIGNETISNEKCSLKQLETKTCKYEGVEYNVKREIGCNLIISINNSEQEFTLAPKSKKILSNGVGVMNPLIACSSQDLVITFFVTTGNESTTLSNETLICKDSCPLEGKCYSFGYRKSQNFCSDTGSFIEQTKDNEKCDNNFECSSNVCVNGKCVSGNLIEAIINWFKKLFGG